MTNPRSRPARPDEIGRLSLLDGLPETLVASLARASVILDCPGPVALFAEGERPHCLYVLLDGMVELFTGAQGRETVTSIVWPGELFLPAAALADELYLVGARTTGRARLICIHAGRFRTELAANAVLAARVNKVLCGQFRMLQRSLIESRQRAAPQRLGAFLLRLIQARGKQGCVDLPVRKYSLASRLSMSPESVSRSLRVLRRHGLVMHGSRAVIANRARLERFCRPDPLRDGPDGNLDTAAM